MKISNALAILSVAVFPFIAAPSGCEVADDWENGSEEMNVGNQPPVEEAIGDRSIEGLGSPEISAETAIAAIPNEEDNQIRMTSADQPEASGDSILTTYYYYGVIPSDFEVYTNGTSMDRGYQVMSRASGESNVMIAPIHLEDTAIIDTLECYVRDYNAAASAWVKMQLERKYSTTSEVCCSDTSNDDGYQTLTCNNACEEDVDNALATFNMYYIKAEINIDTDTTYLRYYHCSVKWHLP